ncbi:MAG: hypothetical protein WDM90_12430 [Ferruginibacter sp.]
MKARDKVFEEFTKKGGRLEFNLMPFTTLHLHGLSTPARLTTLSDIKYVYIFSVIALFIIILACVNFMNLIYCTICKKSKGSWHTQSIGFYKNPIDKTIFNRSHIV